MLLILLEKAWKAGFDVDGAAQFGWSLLGTDLWIGMIITIIQFVIASTAVVIMKMIAVTHYLLCYYIKITSTSTILISTIKTAIMNIKDYFNESSEFVLGRAQ